MNSECLMNKIGGHSGRYTLQRIPSYSPKKKRRWRDGIEGWAMDALLSDNLLLARRFINECWNEGQVEVLEEIMSAEHVHHFSGVDLHGRQAVRGLILAMRTAFPDLHISIEDEIVGGDKVVLRWRTRATHLGDFNSMAPTRNELDYTGIDIIRFEGGRIVELWNQMDELAFNRQLNRLGPLPPLPVEEVS